ncbi:membrane-bound lytic murein transglycosylase MltF [Pseudoalteromonas sp. SSM20]|uniref:membrane-bound lytic murein transglycosylase MltF n=1 Tax=Pseudoalteromonas sp. SSM20 TaxID=3139394 RepID=UPI003BAC89B7
MLKRVVITVIIFLLAACSEPVAETHLGQIKQKDKIRIGTLAGESTYYISANGELGFEYELAQAFADYIDAELEIIPFFSIKDMLNKLDKGQIDILASGLTLNNSRLEKYRFAPEYRAISQKLVYKQGRDRPRNFEQLDAPVTVIAKSAHAASLLKAKANFENLQWIETEEFDEAELLQGIIDGKFDYTIADSHTLALFRRYHPELSIAFSVTREEPVAWMLKRNDDDSLYALTIEFFGYAQATGLLQNLEEKYFGHVRQFNYINTLAYIEAVRDILPKYKDWFKQYSRSLDWRLLAAVSYQESMWDPKAKSPTGVRGIMMLTLPTAKSVGVKNRLEPEQNIRGGGIYLEKLINRVPERIQEPDRTWLALAAYNVGFGHMEDARVLTEKAGGDPDKWADVKKHLPLLIKKRYYRQTRYGFARGDVAVKYVDNIRRYYDTLVWLDENQDE